MIHSYKVAGITCEGCVAEVKSKLLIHPDITEAVVTLEGQTATVTMQRHLTVQELQEAIGSNAKYKISEDSGDPSHQTMGKGNHKSRLATYKPLLIILVFITGVSLILAFHGGQIHWMMFMNYFMAGFFLVFAFFKLLDVEGFASSYSMYDLLAKRSRAYGFVYPFIELALGIAYLINFRPFFTNIIAIVLMGFSSLGVIQSVVDKKEIRCACLGAVFNLPMSTVTIVEDLLMVSMASTMILFS